MRQFKYKQPLNTGDFRNKIEFKYLTSDTDDMGFPIENEVTYAEVWAKLRTLRGNTFYAAATNNMEHNREFIIRYNESLSDGERPHDLKLYWKGIAHDIESIENDDGLNKTMTIFARAVS